jgi:YHS domain-containing protein
MRILIILALFLVLYYMLRGLFRPRVPGRDTKRPHPDAGWGENSELVKDPYCQTFVPVETALQAKIGGKELFFCSEDCMNRYVEEKNTDSL